MNHRFTFPLPTVAELEVKASECEQFAEEQNDAAAASLLRAEADRLRRWAASLTNGRWTA